MKQPIPERLPQFYPERCLSVCAACLCLLLMADLALAQQAPVTPWYEVEVIVFRNRPLQADGEQWPAPGADGESQFTGLPDRHELQELATEQYALNNIASALQRSGSYEVLLHRAWRQPGNDRTTALPYLLPPTRGGDGNVLGGTIRLVRGRFLHLDVDITAGPSRTTPDVSEPRADRYPPLYRLHQARRVRSGELHYFDHPYFGIIARVVPYSAPELPVPVGTVRMEKTDPRVIADEPAPHSAAEGAPARGVQ